MARWEEFLPQVIAAHNVFDVREASGKDAGDKCWNCDNKTDFMNVDFQIFVCSDECLEKMWQDYYIAYNRATDLYGDPYEPGQTANG